MYMYIITVRQVGLCVEVWCDPQRDIRRRFNQTRILYIYMYTYIYIYRKRCIYIYNHRQADVFLR